jgi:N-terminal domain of anti-restriction factor ArdC
MSRSRKLTERERDERRQADRDRLEHAARELLSSEGWARWVRVRASNGLGRYSLRNQWLVAADCYQRGITPTYVAGFRAWLALNRVVRKGSKAIYILAPVSVKSPDGDGQETGEKRIFFRSVPVFDVAMTDVLPGTQPIALCAPSEPITGESHAHLLEPLARLAGELGYQVRYRPIDGSTGGWCDVRRREIIVDDQLPANAKVRVLVHEIAHSLGVGYSENGRAQAEVLVDTVTYVVLAGQAGLDVSGESIPYVAGWGEQGALDAIREFAITIDQIARRIEDAVSPVPAPVPADHPSELARVA